MNSPRFLVVSDLDGTLTEVHSAWQYVMVKLGFWESHGKHHLRNFLSKRITYDDFIHLDVETLAGTEEKKYLSIIKEIPFRSGVIPLFQYLKQQDAYIILLSTGLMDLAQRAQNLFPVDYSYANVIHKENGKLNGKFTQHVGWHDKRKIVLKIKEKYKNIPMIALGDTSGDTPLIELADLSFACFSSSESLNTKATHQVTNLKDALTLIKSWIRNLTN